MKIKRKSIFGMIILVVFGSLLIITCDLDFLGKNPFVGTWVSSEGYTTIWDDTSWHVVQYEGGVGLKGTYTYNGNTATVAYTEITNDGLNWRPITFSESFGYVNTATVSGNKLTWGATVYTRK